jgi:hypothetical protein
MPDRASEDEKKQSEVGNASDKEAIESRRKFLKTSVVAGAAAAVLVSGAAFVPKIASTAMSSADNESTSTSINSKDPLVVIIDGEKLNVYQGEKKFPVSDPSLARDITSSVKRRV